MGRLHLIYDPHLKIDNRLPAEYVKKWDIAVAMIDLPDNPALVERAVIDLGLKLAAYFHNPDV